VLLCAGKIYYDLLEYRQQRQRDDVALVRVEQFYPLRDETLRAALAGYDESLPLTWVQEEPRNMGAWPYWRTRYGDDVFGRRLTCVARDPSASPATGSKESHKHEQEQLLEQAFASNQEQQHGH
jgi:2-oxoglutarate dehydrogenase E1 component